MIRSRVFFSITPCLHQCEMHTGCSMKDGSCGDSVLCPLHTLTGGKQLLMPELGMRTNPGSLSRSKIRSLAPSTAERVFYISCLWVTSLGPAQVSESSLPQGGTLSPERSSTNSLKAFCFFWISSQRTFLWPSINLLQRHFSIQMLWSGVIPKQQCLGRGRGNSSNKLCGIYFMEKTNIRP